MDLKALFLGLIYDMRLKILILMWVIPLSSFSQGKHFFKLSGQLKSVNDEVCKVYLSYRKDRADIFDSAEVKERSYSFNGEIDEPVIAILQPKYSEAITGTKFKRTDFLGQAITIFLEPGNISITNVTIFDSFIVKGSQADIEYRKLLLKATPYDKQLQKLDRLYEGSNDIMEKGIINDQRTKLYSEMKENVYLNFLEKNPRSSISMYVLEFYSDDTIDVEKLKPLYDMLPKNIQQSPSGIRFIEKINNIAKLAVMQPAIDFNLKDTMGKVFELKSFRGKYILLDFWASWCIPCRQQNPGLGQIFSKFRDKGFSIVSVSLDLNKSNWVNAINKDQMKWINLSDLKEWANSAAIKYNIESIPQNFLINPEGLIIGKNIWGDKLEEKLSEIYRSK